MINAVQERLAEVIGFSGADQTEVLIIISDSSLTRFANNIIHQNTSRKEISVVIRTVLGKKIGTANVNKLDSASLGRTAEKAIAIAKVAPERSDFAGLAHDSINTCLIDKYDKETSDYSAIDKAKMIKNITDKAKKLNASGSIENGVMILGIANSNGINKTQTITQAGFNLVVSSNNSSGYGSAIENKINDINFLDITEKAVKNALKSQNPININPGKYKVILEPYAVAEMLSMLSYSGMGALSVQEGRSFLSGKINQKIMNNNITIYDEAANPRMVGFGFDYEGVGRQKVVIIEKGIAKMPVYDTQTAKKEGRKTTGHALPASSSIGPLPLNLVVEKGKTSSGDLLKSIDKGIYITRFHYTNLENPVKAVFTGMTRDGTYQIEDGKITKPLKNLRFTQGIVEALNNIIGVGDKHRLVEGIGGAYLVPFLAIDDFNFTSATEF